MDGILYHLLSSIKVNVIIRFCILVKTNKNVTFKFEGFSKLCSENGGIISLRISVPIYQTLRCHNAKNY
jgi:hypothetical protein